MYYDYSQEPNRDIMCIDVTSFYASVECRMRGLNPMTTMLVVMSKAENSGGLCLAASPMAKEKLGITNVTRKYDLPSHPDLIIVPPRMSLYLKFNQKLNDILRNYTSKDFHYIYSIDESFIDVSGSHLLFGTTHDIAKKIRQDIWNTLGLIVKIGIGPNPLLAKVCLDIAAKHNPNFIEQWTYECIPETLWKIDCLTDMWVLGLSYLKN
ncbi:type VI secretion protein ImpB [Vagococcus penaei]|uniref:Y-family DNA polymerase n=1 Tax=Vagococcus penaei TaxID=633807 RepID=UPI001E608B08|nr:type VI secretion protein ImpB [Vagococcus penaei]